MSDLQQIDLSRQVEELIRLGVVTPEELAQRKFLDHRGFIHDPQGKGIAGGKPGNRMLVIQTTLERYDLQDSHMRLLGISRWRHVSVSVKGALNVRLADQKATGRQRKAGERGPAPLPDWYELTHLAYDHARELGFDPFAAVWQYLPGKLEPGLNIAEALHLRQPA